jgi:hypothetical protein
MRSKNLPPDEAARYQAMSEKIQALMDDEGLPRRKRLEWLSMMCADVAKVEGPDCLAFVESVIQGWIEDQQEQPSD